MIVQPIDNERQLIYVNNYETDYKIIGSTLGICSEDGTPQIYSTVRRSGFTNSNGIRMPAWELGGKTTTVYVVNDHVDNVNDTQSLTAALNYFHRPTYSFGKYVFTGKFNNNHGTYVIYDSMNRSISLNQYNVKDLRGIYDLMAHLSINNGKLFEPLLARYVYSSFQISRKRLQVVGYFDLEEYLRIIQDDRSKLFTIGSTKSSVYIETGANARVSIVGNTDGMANVSITNCKSVIDMTKANSFRPFVIFSMSPLNIRRDMTFPWSRVVFDRKTVFMTPIMSKSDAWETLQGGIDLLTPFFTKKSLPK